MRRFSNITSHVATLAAVAPLATAAVFACRSTPTEPPVEETPAGITETHAAKIPTSSSTAVGGTDRSGVGSDSKDVLGAVSPDMRKVLAQFEALGPKPFANLSAPEARMQPSLADAVRKVQEREGKPTDPLAMASVEPRTMEVGTRRLDAKIYTPVVHGKKALPVVAYFHGGGFVVGGIDTYDASARALAKNAESIVVSLGYRRAPEHKFPAAHDDAYAGYHWVTEHAVSFGGDPKRIAVAGESAGANLALNVAIMVRDKGEQAPLHALLVYPVVQTDVHTRSYDEWAYAKPLGRSSMAWFFERYLNSHEDEKDPRINLTRASLSRLPRTTVVLAEIDPLRSEGELLASKLKDAGVDVQSKTYERVTHEFFGTGAVVSAAQEATALAGTRLKASFKK